MAQLSHTCICISQINNNYTKQRVTDNSLLHILILYISFYCSIVISFYYCIRITLIIPKSMFMYVIIIVVHSMSFSVSVNHKTEQTKKKTHRQTNKRTNERRNCKNEQSKHSQISFIISCSLRSTVINGNIIHSLY